MQSALLENSLQADLNNMQPQSAPNMYVSTGNNNSAVRTNPSTGNLYRGPPTSNTVPRGYSTRHVHMPTMYQPQMHQNMVLPAYSPFTPRQPTFPAAQYQYTHTPIPTAYYPYQYLSTIQQPQAHQRNGVTVSTGVEVANTMPVQSGPNGHLAGPGSTQQQMQIPAGAVLAGAVQPGTGGVIGVGGGATGQVGVTSIVSVVPTAVSTAVAQQTNRRRHQHRLKIIDPNTNKNILDELEKNSNSESEYHEQMSSVTNQAEAPICVSQQEVAGLGTDVCVALMNTDTCSNMSYNQPEMSQTQVQREVAIGPTPIVSARTDAPSVEIFTTPQKQRSKKVPITVSQKDELFDKQKQTNTTVLFQTSAKKHAENSTLKTDCVTKRTSGQYQHIQVAEVCSSDNSKSICTESDIVNTKNDTIVEQDLQSKERTVQKEQHNTTLLIDHGLSATAIYGQAEPEIYSVENLPSNLYEAPKSNIDSDLKTEIEANDKIKENVDLTIKLNEEVSALVMNQSESITCSNNKVPELNNEIETEALSLTQDETDQAISISNYQEASSLQRFILSKKAEESKLIKTSEMTAAASSTPQPEPKINTETNPSTEEEPTILKTIAQSKLIINYNEGQWSPNNPNGKKQYNREQLLQLRDAKASRIQPEVNNVSILPQSNLMPSFVRNNNKRVQSLISSIGNNRNTDGLGVVSANFISKQASLSGVHSRNTSMKGMIHVNLSLNQDVKLNETDNAWRPSVLLKSNSENDPQAKIKREKEELVRRVRGILNKLTPEKFDTLVEEIIKLKIDTPDKMDEVMVLVFEKAIDEPNFSVSYARLCHRLIAEVKARDERMESGTKSNLAHFRNVLLDKTEREFTQNVSQSTAKEQKLQPIVDKIKCCTDSNEKAELEATLEEEERKIRKRSGGTVRFMGELFKISMLTGKIIYSCIDTLLNPQSEDMLECLCKLLTTVGAKLEQTPINSKEPVRCYSLEKPIAKMQAIASKTDKDGAKVSSRVRFMLQDVIDLRKDKWQSKRNESPKTMDQIEKEAKSEQLSAQYLNYSGSVSSTGSGPQVGSKREDRNTRYSDTRSGYTGSHSQRGDSNTLRRQQQGNNGSSSIVGQSNNNDDNTWHVQTSKGSRSQALDSNKLEGLQNLDNLGNKKMGGVSQFIWNNNVSRQSSTSTINPSNSFAVLSSLMDKNGSERDRDRSGPRNKGSYNKGSIERDRYSDRALPSRTSQNSRENSSSRGQVRGLPSSSSVNKSTSQNKYIQQISSSRLPGKVHANASSTISSGLYRSDQHQNALQSSAAYSKSSFGSPIPIFEEPNASDLKTIKSVVAEMIELASTNKSVSQTAVLCINNLLENQRCGFLYYILTDYLHLVDVGSIYRRYLANIVICLITQNHLSVEHFKLAYKEFSEIVNDLIVDVPPLWLYIFQFTGPLIVKKLITINDLWTNQLKETNSTNLGKKFLKAYLAYCTHEVGPSFTRNMWKKFDVKWKDFMPEGDILDFIQTNKLEYIEDEAKQPVIEFRDSYKKHVKMTVEHVENLLNEGSNADCIIDFLNGNIVDIDKHLIRSLTRVLSNFAIAYKESSYKLETEYFQKVCVPVLQRYIDSQEERELECLYSMQLIVHSLEHPRGLLSELFGELYDNDVIPQDSFIKWRDSNDQSAGKGVAVKGLNPFFNIYLKNPNSGETSDENNS